MPQPPGLSTDRTIVDVRTRSEFDHEHIPGSTHRPLLRALTGPRLPADALVICHSGPRAALVASLRGGNAYRGGIVAWRRNGGPVQRSRSERWGVLALGITIAAVAVTALHVAEDLGHGVASGVPRPLAVGVLILVLLAELIAATLAAIGGRVPALLLVLAGGLWTIAAGVDHAGDLVAADFRGGLASKVLIVALIGLQSAVAVAAAVTAVRASSTSIAGADGRGGDGPV